MPERATLRAASRATTKSLLYMFSATINLDHATEALDTLSPEHRQAIHLAYYGGFDTEQVAHLIGVTVEVADGRLADALASLREALHIAA
jgi:DNA-directed RNA polymerase specialized sigma24 family protein